jgi:Na+/H+-dicarboxylate symporter
VSEPAINTGGSGGARRPMQLYTKILIGMVSGIVLALLVKQWTIGPLFADQAALVEWCTRWIEPVGKLFIRAIILTVVPLVFTSIASGVYSLGDPRELGRIGAQTIVVFLSTSLLAACIGTCFYLVFQPGRAISAETRDQLAAQFAEEAKKNVAAADQAADFFSGSPLQVVVGLVPENIALSMTSNRDLLEVILFALAFGVALTLISRERSAPVAAVLEGVNEAITRLISMLMTIAPYGVGALVFMVVVKFGTDVLVALAYYTLIVVLALAAHVLLVLAPLVRVLGGWNPLKFAKVTREIWVTAFSTSSSSATLPTTLRVTEQGLGVPQPIAGFVLPLGATINMDGTTIYQVIAVLFVAQVWGVPLEAAAYGTLIVVAMMMAIGAAGVPGGVIPLLYVVMVTVGIPETIVGAGIALILGVDRLLDMCRSAVNVIGDSATAVVVANLERKRGAKLGIKVEAKVEHSVDAT